MEQFWWAPGIQPRSTHHRVKHEKRRSILNAQQHLPDHPFPTSDGQKAQCLSQEEKDQKTGGGPI